MTLKVRPNTEKPERKRNVSQGALLDLRIESNMRSYNDIIEVPNYIFSGLLSDIQALESELAEYMKGGAG